MSARRTVARRRGSDQPARAPRRTRLSPGPLSTGRDSGAAPVSRVVQSFPSGLAREEAAVRGHPSMIAFNGRGRATP